MSMCVLVCLHALFRMTAGTLSKPAFLASTDAF